jgi:hypothetical protein
METAIIINITVISMIIIINILTEKKMTRRKSHDN